MMNMRNMNMQMMAANQQMKNMMNMNMMNMWNMEGMVQEQGPYSGKGARYYGKGGVAEVVKYNSSPIKSCKKELVLYIGGFPDDHHHDPAFDNELLDFFNH